MLVLDAEKQSRHRRLEVVERTRAFSDAAVHRAIGNASATIKPDECGVGPVPVTSLTAQLGHPLPSNEIIRRLNACNPYLQFEKSRADATKMGIYTWTRNTQGDMERRFICGFESGYSPEFSVRHSKKEKMPHPTERGQWVDVEQFERETRGWRTVLQRLMRAKLITQGQVNAHFPSTSRISKNWMLLTKGA